MYRLGLPITNHDVDALYAFEQFTVPARGRRLRVKKDNPVRGAEMSRFRADSFSCEGTRKWRFRDGVGYFKTDRNRRKFAKKPTNRSVDHLCRFHPTGELLEFVKAYLQFPVKIAREEFITYGPGDGDIMTTFVFWSESDRTVFKLWFIP